MSESPMLSVREYLETYQKPHSGSAPLKSKTARLAKILAASAGIEPGVKTDAVMHKRPGVLPNTRYQVKTYPKEILEQAFRQARG